MAAWFLYLKTEDGTLPMSRTLYIGVINDMYMVLLLVKFFGME